MTRRFGFKHIQILKRTNTKKLKFIPTHDSTSAPYCHKDTYSHVNEASLKLRVYWIQTQILRPGPSPVRIVILQYNRPSSWAIWFYWILVLKFIGRSLLAWQVPTQSHSHQHRRTVSPSHFSLTVSPPRPVIHIRYKTFSPPLGLPQPTPSVSNNVTDTCPANTAGFHHLRALFYFLPQCPIELREIPSEEATFPLLRRTESTHNSRLLAQADSCLSR